MRGEKAILTILVFLAGLHLVVGSVQATGYDWDKDTSGSWYDSEKWNPTGIPGGYGDIASINREPAMGVVVTLGFGAGLNSLTVEMGNSLAITAPRGELNFGKNDLTSQPTLMNNGSINISDYGYLRAAGDLSAGEGYELTIMGSGTISLHSGGSLGSVNFGQVIIDIDQNSFTYNTVLGGGSETSPGKVSGWSVDIPLINRGEINADMGYLAVSKVRNEPLSWNGTVKGGVLGTINQGTLVLSNSIVNGFIAPRGGTVQLYNANLRNTSIRLGRVDVTYTSPFWGNNELQPGAQINILPGTRLDLYNSVITNNGIIRIEPGGVLKNFQSQAVLQGIGKVLLTGSNSALQADGASTNWILNNKGHSIEGGGAVTAWIANSGTVLANDHTLLFWGSLFGTGMVRIEGQDAGNLAILDYRSSSALTTGCLYINEFGKLLLVNNNNLNVQQDFSFALHDESLWPMADKVLNMTGSGDWQALEAGGEDLGQVAAGFTNNFSMGTLHIDDNANVYLADAINNGNRHSPEALYVNDLIIDSGATLNLNGIILYTYLSGITDPVRIDESTYAQYVSFFDGLINSFPQPDPDANGDSEVDLVDFALLAKHWQAVNCTETNWCQRADMDRSGVVGMSDLLMLAEHWLE